MNTISTSQRPVIRSLGFSLLVASLTASALVLAQQPAPVAPAPALPPIAGTGETAPAPVRPVTEPPSAGPLAPIPTTAEGAPAAAAPRRTVQSTATSRRGLGAANVVPTDQPTGSVIVRSAPGSSNRIGNVARTAVDEEMFGNPQEAAHSYEAIIAGFDSQRENAAQAVIRLAEAYRKLDRLDEARIQYARILREFVDFPELARLSQKQLADNAPRAGVGSGLGGGGFFGSAASPSPGVAAEERKLLNEELALLEHQLAEMQERVKNATESSSAVIPIQREILHLKQQLLRLAPPATGSEGATAPPVQEVPRPRRK